MKTITTIITLTFFLGTYAQTQEEIMYPDKLKGTLVEWSEVEKETYLKECNSNIEALLENSKEYCDCALKSLSTGVNYSTYENMEESAKAQVTFMHGKLNCKAVMKEE